MEQSVRAFLAKIRSVYPSLSGTEVRVADFFLQRYADVGDLSVSEVAEQCGVSDASVVRLCQNLGYRGYQEVRLIMAASGEPDVQDIHARVRPTDSTPELLEKVFHSVGQALEDTRSILDPGEFEKAVGAIAGAKTMDIYGVGGSGAIAFDAAHMLLKIGLPVRAYNDPHLQAMSASLLTAGDVVLGISHSGTTVDVIHALELARESGATTISLTGYSRSPITRASDIRLVTAPLTKSPWGEVTLARMAEMMVLNALYVAVSMRRYEQSLAAISRTSKAVAAKRL